MERMKKIRYPAASAKALCRRGTALWLDACMLFSMFGGLGLFAPAAYAAPAGGSASRAGGSGGTNGVTRQADPSTMDDYQKMLDFSEHTRYAGRVWSDKTVFALGDNTNDQDDDWDGKTLTLTEKDDGVEEPKNDGEDEDNKITLDEDFLHVYSVLGSSQEIVGVPPVRTVIVFDNSGSMYGSSSVTADDSEHKITVWSGTRIAKTVDAINAAIDTLMLTSEYNEVSVVLFGDGVNGGEGAAEADSTMRYHGNNTAVTILPMKHYTPSEDAETEYKNNGGIIINNTPYLTAGWLKGDDLPDGAAAEHRTNQKGESGCVFVNNTVCKLNRGDTTAISDNAGHQWFDDNKGSWNGWNGCGDHQYTCYANGTTNIQAGMYQGMQELLNADKTETIGTQEYQCVPSLVVLTDGAVTDALDNWMEPTTKTAGAADVPSKDLGFVSDFSFKGTSFVEHNDSRGTHGDKKNTAWNQFLAVKSNKKDVADPKQSLSDEAALVQNGDYYYEAVASDDAADEKIHYEPYVYAKHPDPESPNTTKATGPSETAMQELAKQYRDNEAYMIFSYLLTSAYYKQAVKKAYNVNSGEDWGIYTITVDMPDPSTEGFTPGFDGNNAGSAPITSNPVMMDPGKYFSTDWLKKSKYLNTDGGEADNTYYDDYTVGDMTVEGIQKAIQAWTNWNEGKAADTLGLDNFRSFLGGTNLSSNHTKDKIKVYTGSGTGPINQDTTNTFDKGFPSPGHSSFFRVYAPQTRGTTTENGDYYIPTKEEALAAAKKDGFQFDKLDPAYVTKSFYADVAGGTGKDIAGVFVEIMDAITAPLFTPVGGMNDLGVSDAVTYMDPVGKYMDVKDVKKLVLFGDTYDITKTAVYDYQWNHQYLENSTGLDSTAPLPQGWYKGDPASDDVTKWEGANTTPEGSARKAWAAGWVYRIGYDLASQYVPTLATINEEGDADDTVTKMRNTEYTFYRIDDVEIVRQALHVNPAYLEQNQTEAQYLKEKGNPQYDPEGTHRDTPGVYALSDLRIWVEDSGDYSDDVVESGGVMSDANFDEALWINIPVNMLPVRTVTVNLGKTGNSDAEWTYTTNLEKESAGYKASFPLRVFYTVGMSEDVLENGRINMAGGIKAEYILQNKITDEDGHTARNIDADEGDVVEFFSNWYNPLNRYNGYATTSTDYTYGDPVTTFSPAAGNRYYVFEKALPLYKNAYVWVKDPGQWRRVQIIDGGGADEGDDVARFTAAEFGKKAVAVALETDALDPAGSPAQLQQKLWEALNEEGYYRTEEEAKAHNGKVVEDGEAVLLEAQQLPDVTRPTDEEITAGSKSDPFPSEGYFFLPIEYYELGDDGQTTWTQYVIARKGSEFGSAYEAANITNGDMLCWHDVNGKNPDYPYVSFSETSGAGNADYSRGKDYIGAPLGDDGYYQGCDRDAHALPAEKTNVNGAWEEANDSHYVLCAKPGGLRVGNLAQSVQQKGGELIQDDAITNYYKSRYAATPDKVADKTWAFYSSNITRTANNYYVPTISNASDLEHEDAGVKVNVYLGNNGRLYVADTTLLVTKSYQDPAAPDKLNDTTQRFNYQVYLRGVTGTLEAIVVRWNDAVKGWQRQYHYIDLELDGQLFLQTQDGKKAMVDADGNRVTEDYDGPVYYVYIGKNKTKAEIGASDTAFRVYHNSAVDENGNVDQADVTTGGAASGASATFYAAQVYLVPKDTYDTEWNGAERLDPVTDTDFDASKHGGQAKKKFELLTLDPDANAETTEILIETPYLTNSAYWTQTVTFGVNANDDGDGKQGDGNAVPAQKLDAGDLYDGIVPSYDYPGLFNEKNQNTADNLQNIADNTAEFTLGAGEALLFSGLPSDTVYRVTEKLTDAQLKAGYTLKELSHNQQQGSTSTYRPGIQSLPVYLNADATYGMYYGTLNDCYPTQFATNETEKDLIWALDSEGNQNDETYLTYEPFHHTNAILWEYYATMDADANGDNHHQPKGYLDNKKNGTSPFYRWDESKQQTEDAYTVNGEIQRYTVTDNPSCKPLAEGGCDQYLDGEVRHYMFKDGVMIDQHYQGEGSGYLRNIARYLVTPTVHFGVKDETQAKAETAMPDYKPSADYTGVYSVFGNTGTFEESANFVNTIQKNKVETAINDSTDAVEDDGTGTQPGVQVGDTITYQIKWANTTTNEAHVVIIDPLDNGVDFVRADGGGRYYETMEQANDALADIYDEDSIKPIPTVDYDHVVIWDLGVQGVAEDGAVTLTVKVNKKAAEWWDYDGDGVADEPKQGETPPEDYPTDHLVRDRATVRVAENAYHTNLVENPVGEPDKTETHIERGPAGPGADYHDEDVTEEGGGANLKPGEDGKWHGPLVFAGDTITYEIDWRNYENEPATVTIRDPLDANVRFVSAGYDPAEFKDAEDQALENPSPSGPQGATGAADNTSVSSGEQAVGYEGTAPDTIAYDADTHTVAYSLGTMPSGASGTVTLVVEVLDSALPAGYVDNTAYVKVGNDTEQQTKTVENPTPHLDKTETTPGDGVMVQVGELVTYEITWQNYKAESARVIVMDTLDPGVDFVEADNGGVYHDTADEVPASGDYTEAVTIPPRTVVWELGEQLAGDGGTVTLTVRVNENAKVENKYTETADSFTGDPGNKDLEVLDQARVKVGNDSFLKTDIVENPVPEKTETKVNEESSDLAPKEGADSTYTGPLVFVGDTITYEIGWKNGHDTAADVCIVDPLDPGVDFESADNDGTYDKATHTVTWLLKDQAAGATGTVTLTVKVNEKATPAGMVDNQASVRVNGDPFVMTETIENPTPKVEKAEITPGEGMQVAPGDDIEYSITWRNYEEEAADVIIIDKLDPGVDFVSAVANGVTLDPGNEPAAPTEANLTVRLEGGEGVDTSTDFTFTLELTAPDGEHPLSSDGYTWQKIVANGSAAQGTWKAEENTLILRAGESLTVQDLPVGTKYTLTPEDQAAVAEGTLGLHGSRVTVKTEAVQQPAALMDTAPVAGGPEIVDAPQPSDPETAGNPVDDPADEPTETPANARQKSPPVPPDEAGSQPTADNAPNPESSPATDEDAGASPTPAPPAEDSQDEGGPGSTETPPPTGDGQDAGSPGGAETPPPAEGSQDEGDPETPPPDGETTPQPTDDPDTGLPGTGVQGDSTQDTAGNTDGPADGEPRPDNGEPAPNGPETAVTYVFTAQIEDLPAPDAAAADLPMPMALVDGFDTDTNQLNGETALASASAKDASGNTVRIYYYTNAHTVVWVLEKRPAGTEGSVSLKVRVNADADKLWSYDNPADSPSDTEQDDRVRNQAGVRVGNDALVKTRIIENPTEPQKTETNINDTDVSHDLTPDEDGYVGPQVHVGDIITYRITWQNNAVGSDGLPASARIVITDTLDAHVDFVDASTPGSYDAATHTVTWDLNEVEPGDRGFVTLRVRVNATAETKIENGATVEVGENEQVTDVIENPVEKLSSLVVKKTVDGNAGNKAALWHFRVVVDKPITGLYGEMNFTSGVATFTLTDGQECRATDLPGGITYTVTEDEADLDGYTTTQTGASDTIPAGGERRAEFTNSKNIDEPEEGKGHLIVTKTVTGSMGDVNRVWHFRVELSDHGINGTYGEMTFTGGVAEFTLKHGESAAALNLPAGITYTVTEDEADRDGYATTKNGATGMIPKEDTEKAEFINRKDPTPPPPPPPETPPPTPTPSPTPPPSTRIPQTSDDSPLLLWVMLLAASALGLCATAFVYWNRKGRKTTRQREK